MSHWSLSSSKPSAKTEDENGACCSPDLPAGLELVSSDPHRLQVHPSSLVLMVPEDFLSNIIIKLLHTHTQLDIWKLCFSPLSRRRCARRLLWHFCSSIPQKQLIHCISDRQLYTSEIPQLEIIRCSSSDNHHLQKQETSYGAICQEISFLALLYFVHREWNPHTAFEVTFPRSNNLNMKRKKEKRKCASLTIFHFLSRPFLASTFVSHLKCFSKKFFWNITDQIR